MSRYNLRKLSTQYQKIVLEEFYHAVLKLKNIKEAEKFFNDLFDINEIGMLSRRVITAKMLFEQKTYQKIAEQLKMGMDTIAKVDKKFKDGEGYKLIIKRLSKRKP